MIKSRKKIPIVLGFTLILLFPFSPGTHSIYNTDQQKAPLFPELQPFIATYENYITRSMTEARIPGVAATIVKDSVIIFLKGFGIQEIGLPDSITTHSIFRLASLSKGFAAVLTGIIISDSLLSWNDKISTYLPSFTLKSQQQASKITVTHLLSHTTGIPYHAYTNLIEYGKDLSYIMKKFKDVEPIADPGELYSYQNAAFSLIAEVLASATGKSFADLLQEKIFIPLTMTDASADYQSIVHNPSAAQPHLPGAEAYRKIKISPNYYNAIPAGGINASISDMAQWLLALLGNNPEIITAETLEAIFHPVVETPIRYKYGRFWSGLANAHYALGWRIFDYTGQTIAYHGGYVNGYRSEIALNYKQKIGICVLTNAPSRFANECIPTFFGMYQTHLDSLKLHIDSLAESK
jgi:beta-lactamase class C